MNSASLRSMRMLHVILLASIFAAAYIAERVISVATFAPDIYFKGLTLLAVADGIIAFVYRRRLLRSAMEGLQRDSGDAAALAQWRKANVFGMVMAVSISLYGFVLRAIGGSRLVAAPFFVAGVILMLLWRPQLDETAGGANTAPPPLD